MARTRHEEALALYRALGDRRNAGLVLCDLATLGDRGGVERPGDLAD